MSMIESAKKITEEIRQYIAAEFLLDDQPHNLEVTDLLFEGGIVDSADAIALVMHLEQRYGIEITDKELFPDNFATIGHIVQFVERKKNGQFDLLQRGHGK